MNGCLSLRAGIRHGQTVLLESRGTYPLQVMRPHTGASDGRLSVVVLLLSAGLLAGDHLRLEVVLEAGARLALRTQAATQVHAGTSDQVVCARLDERAWLSYVPHALVPHAAADFHGRTCLEMHPSARALVAELLSPGRARHGEAFAYRRVRLDFDARVGGMLIARERANIRPDAALRFTQLGEWSHVLTAYALGDLAEPCVDDANGRSIRAGTSALAGGGWLVRALADRAADLDALVARLDAGFWGC